MTDTLIPVNDSTLLRPQVDRAQAFVKADRHSRRVRRLRRLIIVGSSIAIVAFLGALIFNPFRDLPGNVSIGQATLNGTKVTMELPKLSGFRPDGRPYEVRAKSGVQDVRTPKVIELNEIEARIRTADDTNVNISAPRGVYDSAADTMALASDAAEGRIRITSSSGYDIVLRSADVRFKDSTMTSDEPVTVRMKNNTVSADKLEIADKGSVVIFSGNVKSTIVPDLGLQADQVKGEQ
ncbi:LPS export ABC transporter periplasmic protein LptC [Methylocella sp. CPCC 101449]|jgi:lipopolysaccharide export system protein LptC|uniref:LPS export ABC transporter periplasmic protein LptC n=1 Tax=Methylocella sp. CPCC 101449 TaxID=2987531 RepID=UPI00288FD55F|nr:LPS export ABC transporter periplasmic protein LptC [Methylocella sp. CPCC 101449]MDT2019796.1 LPS export ABC transporter periplasmic protein LptC [Methylocella sp. CPCC 101449]HEV2575298.1 LPS export ABC transporter periplasmic protein LptC [Beijerinckiaceae bacterium]